MSQKRPKLSWLPAAKSTTEQRVKFVPKPVIGESYSITLSAERPASPGQAVTRVSHSTFEVGSALRLLPL